MKRFNRITTFLLMLCFSIGVYSQTFVLNKEKNAFVEMNGSSYAVETTNWVIGCDLTDDSFAELTNCKLIVDNDTIDVTQTASNYSYSGEGLVGTLQVGEHHIHASISYLYHVTDSTTDTRELETEVLTISTYPSWNVQRNGSESINVLSGETDEVTLSASTSGGYADGWVYEWSLDGSIISDAKTSKYSYHPNNEGDTTKTDVFVLHVSNVINGEIVYEDSIPFNVNVYPSVNIKADTSYDAIDGDVITLKAEVTGGKTDGWRYQWSKNNEVIEGDASTLNVVAVNKSDSKITESYILKVTNYVDDEAIFTDDISFIVTIYPEAILETSKTTVNVIGNTNSVNMFVSAKGGYDEGWVYEWKNEKGERIGNKKSYSYSPDNNYYAMRSDKFVLEAKNVLENSHVLFSKSVEFTVNVYPNIIITHSDDNISVQSGNSVNLSAEVLGGYQQGWKYQWYRDDDGSGAIKDQTSNQYVYTPENKTGNIRVEKYRLVYTNVVDGEEIYTGTLSFTVNVLPLVSIISEKEVYNVLNGQSVTLSIETEGGEASGWSFSWIHEKTTISGTTKNKTIVATNTSKTKVTEHYTIHAIYKNQGIVVCDSSITFTINIFPSTVVEFSSPNDVITYGGCSVTSAIKAEGGNASGWKYEWRRNNQPIKGATSSSYTSTVVNDNSSGYISDVYTVIATNTVDGEELDQQERSFHYTVYGKPSGKVTINNSTSNEIEAYFGDEITLKVESIGGFTNGWTYEWMNGNTSNLNTITLDNSYPQSPYSIPYYIVLKNKYKDEVWYSDTLYCNIKAWEKPSVSDLMTDTINVYAGSRVTLSVVQEGGSNEGWTYSWSVDGKKIDGANSSSYSFIMEDTDNPSNYVSRTYSINAKNITGGKTGCDVTKSTTLRVWHKAIFGTQINAPACVRANTDFIISVDDIQGGYLNSWLYLWTNTDGESSYQRVYTTKAKGTNSLSKGIRTVSYNLSVSNTGPYLHVWDAKNYSPVTIAVYNRPKTPTELVRKGNGTTCTMVVKSDISDEQLASNEYYFVFGYTDFNGNDHAFEATNNRYYKFDNSDLYNNQYSYWVYAVWNYNEGSTVTSGRRFLNGNVDESYDASVFNGETRSIIDDDNALAIHAVTMNEAQMIDNRLIAQFDRPMSGCVSIISMNGKIVRQMRLKDSTSFDECIDLNGLSKGIYLVKCVLGEKVLSNKVIVK